MLAPPLPVQNTQSLMFLRLIKKKNVGTERVIVRGVETWTV